MHDIVCSALRELEIAIQEVFNSSVLYSALSLIVGHSGIGQ